MRILLIGFGHASEIELLEKETEKQGHTPVCVDVRDWPGEPPLSLKPGGNVAVFGDSVDLDTVVGAYVVPHHLLHPFERRIRDRLLEDFDSTINQIREYRALFEGVCGILDSRSRNVIVPLQNHYLQDRKPFQLEVLSQMDIPFPETLFTTDPDKVQEFVQEHDQVIYKPVTRGGGPHIVTEEDLTEPRLEKLKTAPVQFQAFAPGDDVRTYIIDNEIVGSVEYSSDSFSFKCAADDSVELNKITVPTHVRKEIKRATDKLGLRFAGVDLRLKEDGVFNVLEFNEAPNFAAVEQAIGIPVAETLVSYLSQE